MANNGRLYNFKKFREEHLDNVTQEDIASVMGLTQDKISRLERNASTPKDNGRSYVDNLPIHIVIQMAQQLGMSLDELVGNFKKAPEPLQSVDVWSHNQNIKETLLSYITGELERTENLLVKDYAKEMIRLVHSRFRKPRVAFLGRSDVGKSTMINSLLGKDVLPAAWSPTTSISTYIKHTSDKPVYMKQNLIEDDVIVFRSDEAGNVYDDSRLYDKEYTSSLRIYAGGYEILNDFATRDGEKGSRSNATSAVVFMDAPILRNCDFVDLPGYGTDRVEDDTLQFSEKGKADVVVYLSVANAFMRPEECSYVRDILDTNTNILSDASTTSADNLFIVASQAHILTDEKNRNNVLDKAHSRLLKILPESISESSATELRNRFFTYTTNSEEISEKFKTAFSALIESFPSKIEESFRSELKMAIDAEKSRISEEITTQQKLIESRELFSKSIESYYTNDAENYRKIKLHVDQINSMIASSLQESISEFTEYYNRTTSKDALLDLMKQRGVSKNGKEDPREDLNNYYNYVSWMLDDEYKRILKLKTIPIDCRINDYRKEWEKIVRVNGAEGLSFVLPVLNNKDFDTSSVAKSVAVGVGLGLSTLKAGLGGTVLGSVPVLGGVHAALGALTATSVIPVGILLGLPLLAGMAAVAIGPSDWQKSITSKLSKKYKDEKYLESYLDHITSYWTQLRNNFNELAAEMERRRKMELANLRRQASSSDGEMTETRGKITELEGLRAFMEGITV